MSSPLSVFAARPLCLFFLQLVLAALPGHRNPPEAPLCSQVICGFLSPLCSNSIQGTLHCVLLSVNFDSTIFMHFVFGLFLYTSLLLISHDWNDKGPEYRSHCTQLTLKGMFVLLALQHSSEIVQEEVFFWLGFKLLGLEAEDSTVVSNFIEIFIQGFSLG